MKTPFLLFAAWAWLVLSACGAFAQNLSIFADQAFQPAMQEIVPLFTDQTGFEVQLSLGQSAILAERIRSGTDADLFFPASEDAMRQMVEKGLVDVTLKRTILLMPAAGPVEDGIVPEPQRISAAVLNSATNRLQAMAFLEFLVSEPARAAFAQQGFSLP